MEIRRVTTIKDGTDAVGNRTRVKVVKNKMAPPFKQTEFDIMYNQGISYEGDIIDLALKAEVIQKMGSWFSYGDDKIGQGRENAKIYLEKNPKIAQEIETAIRTKAGLISKKIEGNPVTKEKETEK